MSARVQWTSSCPCGGWITRAGADGRVPVDVKAFLELHAGHCTCSGASHAPHLDRTTTQVNA